MSVPVNSSESYQLSARSLYSMWKTRSDDQLKEIGLKEYNVASSSLILVLWLCVTGILFLLFFVILVCAVKTRFVENYLRRKDILGSSNRSWIPYGEKQLVPPFFYPEQQSTKLEETQIKYDIETSLRKRSIGIENPAYMHESSTHVLETQISQTSMVDDFDSEDETIYPPAPLPRPMLIRTGKRRNNLEKNAGENETEL
ncbi:uncharacterized protein LOC128997188 [Macrosteles quadrilineatus]|uniref:uncharacterized protein LOC128997188 n=1 Tax=Macrosteles quadrilineatus TaxID=74068 RepID=UPI0023E1D5ED|nr:uncharacterized protein LOC128997188 [Macrosteles quadrilineatus]